MKLEILNDRYKVFGKVSLHDVTTLRLKEEILVDFTDTEYIEDLAVIYLQTSNFKIILPAWTQKIKQVTTNYDFETQIYSTGNQDLGLWKFLQEILRSFSLPYKFSWDITLQQFYALWFKSLIANIFIGVFMGAAIGFETFIKFKKYGLQTELPTILSLLMINYLGPLVSTYIVAFHCAGAFTADLINSRINEEWKVLKLNGYNPFTVYCWSRIFALTGILFILMNLFVILFIISSSFVLAIFLQNSTILGILLMMVRMLSVESLILIALKAMTSSLSISLISLYYGCSVNISDNIGDSIKTSMFMVSLGIIISNFGINLVKTIIFMV